MTNYYEILGIDQTADSIRIKIAYKRLAMEFHPDRNPGNKQAEEIFKIVNEAYHTLSDPLKKSRYDAQLNPIHIISEEEWREINKRKYYRWQQAQQKRYVIDKEYFRIQALAFLVFIVIAGFCFAILNTAQYFIEQKRLKHYLANSRTLKQAGSLFGSGKFDDAFAMIHTLGETDPMEYRINFTRDSLVRELRYMADRRFDSEDFSNAVGFYTILKKYEQPGTFETMRKISICQYYIGNYKESLQAMKHLHNQEPGSLDLVYSIAMINLEKLGNPEEALHYFTFGKKLFKENLSRIYGTAFEIIMDPADAPDIYFDIFQGRARTNLILNHFEDAVTDCNWAIYLRPGLGEPYKLRAIANTRLKRFGSVCEDIANAKRLGATEIEILERKYCR